MRLLGQILLACLVIAALQGILAVLAVGIVLALIVGFIWRPAETIPLFLILLLLRALELWPLETCAAIALLAGSVLIAFRPKRRRQSSPHTPILLPGPSRSRRGQTAADESEA